MLLHTVTKICSELGIKIKGKLDRCNLSQTSARLEQHFHIKQQLNAEHRDVTDIIIES